MKNIAVILCGSGYLDGSEIREAVGVFWALSAHPVEIQCFAPDSNQADVVNCLTGQVSTGETRNAMVESARIARGKVLPLSKLNGKDYDGLIIPGGYGAAKNLCNFATQGSKGVVCAELQAILESMHKSGKPIGAICIAPAILALGFRGKGLTLTVGRKCEASDEIEKLGHKHVACEAHEAYVDSANKVISTPAYMYDDAKLHDIFTGIQKLVSEVVRLA